MVDEPGPPSRSHARDALAERLRDARVRRGWSKETLAHRSGLSFAAIAQIESGRRTNVRPGTLRALAEALDVTVDHLVGGPGDRGLLDHRALLYRSEAEFAGSTVPFLRGAIDANASALVVTTPPRIDLLR